MKHVLELRRLLSEYCKGPYASDPIEFALILRIGGEMQEFDFEGCQRLRRNRKERYVTVDVGFPSARWRGVNDSQIRLFLADAVETGLLCCLRRLEKDKTNVAGASLLADYATARQRFLAPGN